MKKIIGYMRVSTKTQGDSGLGLKAQEEAILRYAKRTDSQVVEMLTEIESGTKGKRPILDKAIGLCKKEKSTLVVSKLDRLYRNLKFVTILMDSGIEFTALDLPEASRLTIHIFAAIAEHEASMISQRTKAALDQKKKQGYKLGKPENFSNEARAKGRTKAMQNTLENENNKKATQLIMLLRSGGMCFNEIVNKLNESGFKASRGGEFSKIQAIRLWYRQDKINKSLVKG